MLNDFFEIFTVDPLNPNSADEFIDQLISDIDENVEFYEIVRNDMIRHFDRVEWFNEPTHQDIYDVIKDYNLEENNQRDEDDKGRYEYGLRFQSEYCTNKDNVKNYLYHQFMWYLANRPPLLVENAPQQIASPEQAMERPEVQQDEATAIRQQVERKLRRLLLRAFRLDPNAPETNERIKSEIEKTYASYIASGTVPTEIEEGHLQVAGCCFYKEKLSQLRPVSEQIQVYSDKISLVRLAFVRGFFNDDLLPQETLRNYISAVLNYTSKSQEAERLKVYARIFQCEFALRFQSNDIGALRGAWKQLDTCPRKDNYTASIYLLLLRVLLQVGDPAHVSNYDEKIAEYLTKLQNVKVWSTGNGEGRGIDYNQESRKRRATTKPVFFNHPANKPIREFLIGMFQAENRPLPQRDHGEARRNNNRNNLAIAYDISKIEPIAITERMEISFNEYRRRQGWVVPEAEPAPPVRERRPAARVVPVREHVAAERVLPARERVPEAIAVAPARRPLPEEAIAAPARRPVPDIPVNPVRDHHPAVLVRAQHEQNPTVHDVRAATSDEEENEYNLMASSPSDMEISEEEISPDTEVDTSKMDEEVDTSFHSLPLIRTESISSPREYVSTSDENDGYEEGEIPDEEDESEQNLISAFEAVEEEISPIEFTEIFNFSEKDIDYLLLLDSRNIGSFVAEIKERFPSGRERSQYLQFCVVRLLERKDKNLRASIKYLIQCDGFFYIDKDSKGIHISLWRDKDESNVFHVLLKKMAADAALSTFNLLVDQFKVATQEYKEKAFISQKMMALKNGESYSILSKVMLLYRIDFLETLLHMGWQDFELLGLRQQNECQQLMYNMLLQHFRTLLACCNKGKAECVRKIFSMLRACCAHDTEQRYLFLSNIYTSEGEEGTNLLMSACARGNIEIVKEILDELWASCSGDKAKFLSALTYRRSNGFDILATAICKGDPSIVDVILESIWFACDKDKNTYYDILTSPNLDNVSLLMSCVLAALKSNDGDNECYELIEKVYLALERSCDGDLNKLEEALRHISAKGDFFLRLLVRSGFEKPLKFIVEKLQSAFANNQQHLFNILNQEHSIHGAAINIAARQNYKKIFLLLAEVGANIYAEDDQGITSIDNAFKNWGRDPILLNLTKNSKCVGHKRKNHPVTEEERERPPLPVHSEAGSSSTGDYFYQNEHESGSGENSRENHISPIKFVKVYQFDRQGLVKLLLEKPQEIEFFLQQVNEAYPLKEQRSQFLQFCVVNLLLDHPRGYFDAIKHLVQNEWFFYICRKNENIDVSLWRDKAGSTVFHTLLRNNTHDDKLSLTKLLINRVEKAAQKLKEKFFVVDEIIFFRKDNNGNNETLLSLAILSGKEEFVEEALIRRLRQATALPAVMRGKYYEKLHQILFEHFFALLKACERGYVNIVRIVLEAIWITCAGDKDKYYTFLSHGEKDSHLLTKACESKKADMVELVFKELELSCNNDRSKVLKEITYQRQSGFNAVSIATFNGEIAVLEVVLDKLLWSCDNNFESLYQALISESRSGHTLLLTSVAAGEKSGQGDRLTYELLKRIYFLLEQSCNNDLEKLASVLCKTTAEGFSFLMTLAKLGYGQSLQFILEKLATKFQDNKQLLLRILNQSGKYGAAINAAVFFKQKECFMLLAKAGADILERNSHGYTAIYNAQNLWANDPEIIKLAKVLDPHAQRRELWQPVSVELERGLSVTSVHSNHHQQKRVSRESTRISSINFVKFYQFYDDDLVDLLLDNPSNVESFIKEAEKKYPSRRQRSQLLQCCVAQLLIRRPAGYSEAIARLVESELFFYIYKEEGILYISLWKNNMGTLFHALIKMSSSDDILPLLQKLLDKIIKTAEAIEQVQGAEPLGEVPFLVLNNILSVESEKNASDDTTANVLSMAIAYGLEEFVKNLLASVMAAVEKLPELIRHKYYEKIYEALIGYFKQLLVATASKSHVIIKQILEAVWICCNGNKRKYKEFLTFIYNNTTLLMAACETGDLTFVKFLLDELKMSLDDAANDDFLEELSYQQPTGFDALHIACFHGHVEVVKELLSNLLWACHNDLDEYYRRLTKLRGGSFSLLITCAMSTDKPGAGDDLTLNLLATIYPELEKSCDNNLEKLKDVLCQVTSKGFPLIAILAKLGYEKSLKYILDRVKIKFSQNQPMLLDIINQPNNFGAAINTAEFFKQKECFLLLTEAGADIFHRNDRGYTAIQNAQRRWPADPQFKDLAKRRDLHNQRDNARLGMTRGRMWQPVSIESRSSSSVTGYSAGGGNASSSGASTSRHFDLPDRDSAERRQARRLEKQEYSSFRGGP